MNRSAFTLEEDLNTLPTLLSTARLVETLDGCLREIEAATTAQTLENAFSWALGYMQALKDMKCLSDRHAPDLRDLVFRAKQRCAIK